MGLTLRKPTKAKEMKIKNETVLGKIVLTATLVVLVFAVVTAVASAAEQLYVNETGWYRAGGAFNASDTPIQHAIDNAIAGIYLGNNVVHCNIPDNNATSNTANSNTQYGIYLYK